MNEGNERFPILLWGDLVKGGRPVLRRALAGFRAHECMYAWVYLTDYLAHRRLLDLSLKMEQEDRRNLLKAFDGDLWTRFDRSIVDPHCQLSKSALEPVAFMACLAAELGEKSPTFVELGSTFLRPKPNLRSSTTSRERALLIGRCYNPNGSALIILDSCTIRLGHFTATARWSW